VSTTFYFFISYIYLNDKLLKNHYEKYKKKKKNPWAQVLNFLLPMVFWSFHCIFCFFYYFLYLLKYQFFLRWPDKKNHGENIKYLLDTSFEFFTFKGILVFALCCWNDKKTYLFPINLIMTNTPYERFWHNGSISFSVKCKISLHYYNK
jgi:hypothetical protein